jgi:hypothetical protein
MNKYPCRDCVLFGNCSQLCEKSEIDGSITTNLFHFLVKERCCIDCGCENVVIFFRHFVHIHCTECKSVYVKSPTNKKYEINRHFKSLVIEPSAMDKKDSQSTTFGEFIETNYKDLLDGK